MTNFQREPYRSKISFCLSSIRIHPRIGQNTHARLASPSSTKRSALPLPPTPLSVKPCRLTVNRKGHEVYRTWVGLQDTETGGEAGVQGFLKLSVTVLGPGDRQRVHDLAEEIQVERDFFFCLLNATTSAGRRLSEYRLITWHVRYRFCPPIPMAWAAQKSCPVARL